MNTATLYGYNIDMKRIDAYNVNFRSMNKDCSDLIPRDENNNSINFVFEDLDKAKSFLKRIMNIAYGSIKGNSKIKGNIVIENFASRKENDYDTEALNENGKMIDIFVRIRKTTNTSGIPCLFKGVITPIHYYKPDLL